MNANNLRYLPHNIEKRYNACIMLRKGYNRDIICRKLKISKSSLCRWDRQFDGTRESLRDKSKRPKKLDKKAHTNEEIQNIKNYLRRNPKMAILDLYSKLVKSKGYTRNISSLYRIIKKLNLIKSLIPK